VTILNFLAKRFYTFYNLVLVLENREVNSIIPSYVMKGNLVDSTTHAGMLDAMGRALQVHNHGFITTHI
jgi:hypothetical protein